MNNKTRIIAFCLALALALAVFVPAVMFVVNPVFASSTKLEEQNRLAEEAKNKKDKAASERAELEKQNKKLNEEIEALAGDISNLNSNIYKKEQEIKENEARIKELEAEIEKNDELLKERLRVMYEHGTTTYLDILFSSKGISDMLLRFEMVTQLYNNDKKLLSELSDKCDESKEKKEQIEKDKALIVSERDVLVSKQSEFDKKVEQNTSQVNELKKDEAYYERMQKEHEQEAKNILAEIERQKKASSSSGSSPSTNPVTPSGSGSLGLPCYEGAPVTSEYGYRILRGQNNYHTGIDFGVPMGTAVLAAEDGVVLASGWRGSYGNCVTIDHGNMVTLYAHNSALHVTAGQSVVRGQKIASAGSTGNSTGPHIHFSVIINGQYVNPRPYLW